MYFIDALILGLIQGFTEFIPISSSGHLILATDLFGLQVGSFVFDAMLNIGTLLALIIYFRADLIRILTSSGERRLGGLVILATLPALMAGIFLQPLAEGILRTIWVVVGSLVAGGIIMLLADLRRGRRILTDMHKSHAFFIGLSQVLAFIPGISRSGITISGALGQGFTREAAAKFSFFLAIPILSAGVLKVLITSGTVEQITTNLAVFGIGIISSFVSGYIGIKYLLVFLKRYGIAIFALYRFILAVVIIVISVLR